MIRRKRMADQKQELTQTLKENHQMREYGEQKKKEVTETMKWEDKPKKRVSNLPDNEDEGNMEEYRDSSSLYTT
ncbi:hypothetical protein Scep_014096 [Stephania cephalantha]|uniref:Uncharacterized protein n=1 Tax=Stephania cephalantha TaxID=152367 RepID=A0AAP0J1X8_9MAGN